MTQILTVYALLDLVAKWLHLLGVLVWMGHNLANVIQNPRYRAPDLLDPEQVQGTFRAALQREHGTFRYASLVTLISGIFMLTYRDQLADALLLNGPAAVTGLGVWCGLLMVANLWFVLWPHQKKVLGFVPADLEERVRCTRITFLSSRTNTILAFPTLFFMVAGAHAPALWLG